jgi:hypothetical protein
VAPSYKAEAYRCSDVAREDRVVIGHGADNPADVLGMDNLTVGAALRQRVEIGARPAVIGKGTIEMGSVRLLVDERKQRYQSITHGSYEADVEGTAIAQCRGADIDLGDARLLREELAVREIRTQ